MLNSNEKELPDSLKQLHVEVNNFGYGFYNELTIHKKKQNLGIDEIK